MSGQEFCVDGVEPGGSQGTRCREQREVLRVIVIDRVKLRVLHQLQCVPHLDAEPAVIGEQGAQ